MKRILALILVLMLLFTSCGVIPEELLESDILGGMLGNEEPKENPDETTDKPQDNTPEHTHSYKADVVAPTCTEGGYTTYTCSGCDHQYVGDVLSALGHTEVIVSGKPATETESGLTDGKKCSVCNTVTVEQKEIPATGHSYTSEVIAPTCTEDGYTKYTCSGCGESYTSDIVLALGHTEVKVDGKAATCTENGLTDGKECSVCHTVLLEQTSIPALGHTEVVVSGKPATETESGLTDGKKCSVCNTVTVEQKEIPATGHSYVPQVIAPTCTEDGYTKYTCSGCGESYTSDVVTALGHTEVKVDGKAATCTETGLTDGKECSVCHTVLLEQTSIPALGHTEVVVSGKPATETESGLTDGKKCSVCNTVTVEQKEIPATGHSYVSQVIAPTCTEDGYTKYTCSGCGESYTSDVVTALGHTEVKVDGTAATCTENGLSDGKECSVCHTVLLEQTSIPALGHTEVVVSGKAPTCTEEGLTDGKKCSVCDTVTLKQTTISVTAHTEVTVNGKAATCTENGLSDGKKCSVCGTVTVVQVTVTATGHNWQAATTEAPKTCLTCGLTEGDKLPSESGVTYSTLNISYINVGQGDSILIKVDDCDILIDGGKSGAGSTVTSYLNSKGVDDIELMINTHPDEDHYGGLTTVLKSFKVEDFWGSSYSKSTSTYTTFKSQLSSEGLSLYTPSVNAVYTYENLTLTVLYAGAGASSSNDSSLVIMLEYGSFRFLFTGDISSTVESKLIGKDLSCDVLKVPHHGSKGSSSASFLSATGADYAVICVGSNSYGHPTTEALNRLSSAGMTVYRTDNNGNVVFSTNGSTLTIPGGSTVGGGSGSGSSGSGSSGSGSSGSGDSGSTSTEYFIGNTESKVFHLPTCSNLPAASKQNVMYNYDWIINIAGYTPCGRCLKNYSGGTTVQYIANKNTKVYHVSTCSYLPSSANRITIYDTTGYTPCSRCIGKSAAASYTLPVTTYQIYAHVNIPAMPKKTIAYCEYGYECA